MIIPPIDSDHRLRGASQYSAMGKGRDDNVGKLESLLKWRQRLLNSHNKAKNASSDQLIEEMEQFVQIEVGVLPRIDCKSNGKTNYKSPRVVRGKSSHGNGKTSERNRDATGATTDWDCNESGVSIKNYSLRTKSECKLKELLTRKHLKRHEGKSVNSFLAKIRSKRSRNESICKQKS